MSLSLEPPLIAIAPGKSSTSWPRIAPVGTFCVNVLSEDQEALCRDFAISGAERSDKFSGVGWSPGPAGAPLLERRACMGGLPDRCSRTTQETTSSSSGRCSTCRSTTAAALSSSTGAASAASSPEPCRSSRRLHDRRCRAWSPPTPTGTTAADSSRPTGARGSPSGARWSRRTGLTSSRGRRRAPLPPAPGRLLVRAQRHRARGAPRPEGRVSDRGCDVVAGSGRQEDKGLFIPPGVAHGFASLTDVLLWYLVDSYYNPATSSGWHGTTRRSSGDWGIDSPVLSARDQKNPSRAGIEPALRPRYGLRT